MIYTAPAFSSKDTHSSRRPSSAAVRVDRDKKYLLETTCKSRCGDLSWRCLCALGLVSLTGVTSALPPSVAMRDSVVSHQLSGAVYMQFVICRKRGVQSIRSSSPMAE
jgi:hypothetical protein